MSPALLRRRPRWSPDRPRWLSVMLAQAAADHGTTVPMILSGSQERNITAARWQVIGQVRARDNYSLKTIGRWLGLHHTSVMNALHVMAKRRGPYNSTLPADPEPYDPFAADLSGEWAI